jgi:hypothetical protein
MVDPMNDEPQWTSKLPLLTAGAIALGMGAMLLVRSRPYTAGAIGGVVLAALGFGLIAYSTTVKTWCAPATAKFGTATWGQHSFHELDAFDCFRFGYAHSNH